jgi:hypothetical protein
MSKLNTLKKQHPDLDISFIDALSMCYKTKYVEMIINITKHRWEKEEDTREGSIYEFTDMGFSEEKAKDILNGKTWVAQKFMYANLSETPYRHFRTINKFVDLNERGLIVNKDVTSYKTTEEMEAQIALAELKSVNKELEKFILKLHEDDEWLIIKPLTYESSKKYGAGTRWCTAAESDQYQFYGYTGRGNLMYIMNKHTGYKVAAFNNLSKDHSRELSFWAADDTRIDSIEIEAPSEIMDIIITDLRNCKQSNYNLASDEIKKIYDEGMNGDKKEISSSLRTLGELMGRINTTQPAMRYEISETGEYITEEQLNNMWGVTTTSLTTTDASPIQQAPEGTEIINHWTNLEQNDQQG